jgi:2,4-dienoyl-CoA reductase-like NADH-dependent reductase (Old Yellow Enzyme family)
MPTLFEPIRIGNIELNNRLIMAPMTRGRADDAGEQPAYAAEYYGQRASAGLIITEATNISPMAKSYIRTPGIYTAEHVESWRRTPDAVHSRDGKIFLQIFHTGRIALPDFLPGGDADAIVYGKLFLANPDLPERFKRDAPLNEPDQSTFYKPGVRGYIDYPTFELYRFSNV